MAAASITIINRGTGAGGENTNINGKSFEDKTSNEPYLISVGYIRHKIPGKTGKYDYYLENITDFGSIVYLTQGGLKSYIKWKFGINIERYPDEAYLIRIGDDNYILKILEKKNQNVAGSVNTKLYAAGGLKDEYEDYFETIPKFKVQYGFCLSTYLEKEYNDEISLKSKSLRKYLTKHNVPVFFGDRDDYFEKVNEWINCFDL